MIASAIVKAFGTESGNFLISLAQGNGSGKIPNRAISAASRMTRFSASRTWLLFEGRSSRILRSLRFPLPVVTVVRHYSLLSWSTTLPPIPRVFSPVLRVVRSTIPAESLPNFLPESSRSSRKLAITPPHSRYG